MVWETPADRRLPRFRLAPEGTWDRVTQVFGAADIDFAEDRAFSRAYTLQGADEAAARALFTPVIRQRLATHAGQRVASDGRHLIWWTPPSFVPQALPKGDAIEAFFERGDAVRRLFSP